MAKIKEISIGRSRKYAWKFGNSVGYNINITIEGDESDIMEMKSIAYNELTIMTVKEEDRCRDEAGANAEIERIKQTEEKVNGKGTQGPKPLEKSEVAETKNAGSKYHVDPKFYTVLSEFEIKCLATFQKYESEGWEISDKQQKIWRAIESKIRKAKGD